MGNKTSSDGTQQGKKILENKLNMSIKTNVLNISEQKLTLKSKYWLNFKNNNQLKDNLKSLDISRNNLERIPEEIIELYKLKVLIINSCNLNELNDITLLIQLNELQCNHNNLENGKLYGLPQSLIRIDLSYNNFFMFPSELSNLTNLKELNLSNNGIELLEGIGLLTSLTQLYLDNNRLRELPEEIQNLSQLKLLSLKFNLFTKRAVTREGQSFPSGLFLSTKLNRLDLEGNSSITKAEVLDFEGINAFLDRRKEVKDKHIQGGALGDLSLFGIE